MDWDARRSDRAERDGARKFLDEFGSALQSYVSKNGVSAKTIKDRVATADKATEGHLTQREAAFLNICAIPVLGALARSKLPRPSAELKVIRAEGHPFLPEYASGPVARPIAHPFGKTIAADLDAIYAAWRGLPTRTGKSRRSGLIQSYPDFGLMEPYRVLFEGKYFDGLTAKAAQRALVRGLYETVFYLGLPPVRVDERPWTYDYACFVALDVSPGHQLLHAWNELPAATKEGFWSGANVHVAIAAAM